MWFFENLQHLLMPFFDLSCHHTSRTYLNASLLQWTAILHLPMHVHILMVYSTYLHIGTSDSHEFSCEKWGNTASRRSNRTGIRPYFGYFKKSGLGRW